jgi:DNA-binding NarL/FixJ family response regulator
MVTRYLGALAAPPTTAGDSNAATLIAIRRLTQRQRDVLDLMKQGKNNKGICRILNIAEPTVKSHVAAILQTLNVTNRTEAVIKASRASAFPLSNSRAPQTYLGYIPGAL